MALAAVHPVSGTGLAGVVVVNIQTAEARSCSDDVDWFFGIFARPDLQTRIWHEGRLVYTSAHARDTATPEWFELAQLQLGVLPTTISIELREAEPGASEANPTWVTCDISAGEAERLEVSIPATGSRALDASGDGAHAARFLGKASAGSEPHPTPAPVFVVAAPNCLHLSWELPAEDPDDVSQTLILDGNPHPVAANASSLDWCGHAERQPHSARLVREWDGWRVAAPTLGVATANGPPPPADLDASGGMDEANVSWSVPADDVARVELSCNGSPCGSGGRQGRATIPSAPGRLLVSLVAIDDGGLRNTTTAETNVTLRPAPPAPSAPRVTSEHDGLLIAWDAPKTAGVARHDIALDALDPAAPDEIFEVAAPATSLRVPGVPSGAAFAITVRAVNANGLSNLSEATAFVHAPPNQPPRLQLLPIQGDVRAGQAYTLEVVARDPDGDRLDVSLDWGDGTAGDAQQPTHTYASPGEYTIRAVASDPFGASEEDSYTIQVDPNLPPRLAIRPSATRLPAGEALILEINASDPEDDRIVFRINWGDGQMPVYALPPATHTYDRPAAYTVSVVAMDEYGSANETTARVVVTAPDPPDEPPPVEARPAADTDATSATSAQAAPTQDPPFPRSTPMPARGTTPPSEEAVPLGAAALLFAGALAAFARRCA